MTSLRTFLRLLCVVDGRTGAEIRAVLGVSRATLKRYLVEARSLGCRIEFDPWQGKYRLMDAGPFDVCRLWQPLANAKAVVKRTAARRLSAPRHAGGINGLLVARWGSA